MINLHYLRVSLCVCAKYFNYDINDNSGVFTSRRRQAELTCNGGKLVSEIKLLFAHTLWNYARTLWQPSPTTPCTSKKRGCHPSTKGCPFFRYVNKGEFTCEPMFHSMSLLATFISFDFVYCTPGIRTNYLNKHWKNRIIVIKSMYTLPNWFKTEFK